MPHKDHNAVGAVCLPAYTASSCCTVESVASKFDSTGIVHSVMLGDTSRDTLNKGSKRLQPDKVM